MWLRLGLHFDLYELVVPVVLLKRSFREDLLDHLLAVFAAQAARRLMTVALLSFVDIVNECLEILLDDLLLSRTEF